MVSYSDIGFPLIANNEVFEMLLNAKRGCGNFTLLGSYETVAFAASLVGLHVSHGAIYNRYCDIGISSYTCICFWAFQLVFCVFCQ